MENLRTKEIIGDCKKELSVHLSFDKIKTVNKKIVDKELSLHKIDKNQKKSNIIVRKGSVQTTDPGAEEKYYQKQSIAQCRMEKFLSMTAADMPAQTAKQLACMNPVLKTPKDTIRCSFCDVLYDPLKKNEHLKSCSKVKTKTLYFGCVQCSFKHTSKDIVAQHVREAHK